MINCFKNYVLPVTAILFFLSVTPAYAYIGPGGAVSSFGALLALIGAVLVAIVGFLWFPIKRMLAKKKHNNSSESAFAKDESIDTETTTSNSDNVTTKDKDI